MRSRLIRLQLQSSKVPSKLCRSDSLALIKWAPLRWLRLLLAFQQRIQIKALILRQLEIKRLQSSKLYPRLLQLAHSALALQHFFVGMPAITLWQLRVKFHVKDVQVLLVLR